MAIPLVYNLGSLRVRWKLTLVAVLGIAGTVGVFVAMLSLARGFRATLVSSGSEGNAIVLRKGATTEAASAISLEQVRIIEDAAGVARSADGPLVNPETVVLAPFQLRVTGTDANVQVRGVSPNVFQVRPAIRITEGRTLKPGVAEILVGRNIPRTYSGLTVGSTVRLGGAGTWQVVGVFDAGGSAFDSEVWCDVHLLKQSYNRPAELFSSSTVRLTSAAALASFKDALTTDPRLTVDASRETDYYEKQSRTFMTLIVVLGTFVVAVMGIGAMVGALNIMYAIVAERSREIATLRALGFGEVTVVASLLTEAVLISIVAGLLGCLAVLPLNGFTTRSMNPETFSQIAFAFRVTPELLLMGMIFAIVIGAVGALPPAIHAARRGVALALRTL